MHAIIALAQLLAAGSVSSPPYSTSGPRPAAQLEIAEPNDNRKPAGRLEGGVLTIRLAAREAAWYPETRSGPGLGVLVFAEEGERGQVPGPLIRVPAGTRIRASVRNTLSKPMMVRGLFDHSARPDSADIAPGATQEFDFVAAVPGTYFYWGRTEGTRERLGGGHDGVLHGAFVVDSAGIPPPRDERLLMISLWLGKHTLGDSAAPPRNLETITVNGLSWPHTERLTYTAGDSVHWRVINASIAPHPMHLHGFYFRVDSRGTATSDTIYSPPARRQVVTEFMAANTTMRLSWVPKRPGNWLFHCHLIAHVSVEHVLLGSAGTHKSHGEATAAPVNHALSGMAGLVTGVYIQPQAGAAMAKDPVARRRLRSFVTTRPNVFGDRPAFSMIVQQGAREPSADSVTMPGSTIVLRRDEPTEIAVHNRTRESVTIHWHGIELESYYDGVGDWSGWGTRLAPVIAPGDSFVVRMTPDRAGTFIYHTHMEEGGQLSSGLYGALLVVPPGAAPDTTNDRVLLLAAGGPDPVAVPFVNGTTTPPPLDLRAGETYRLRLINISPSDIKRVRLLAAADSSVQSWKAFAKDGAELPAHQATMRLAVIRLGPGETYDFEVVRTGPEALVLEILTSPRGPSSIMRIPVRVY